MTNIKLVVKNDPITEQDRPGLKNVLKDEAKNEQQSWLPISLSVGNFIQLVSMDQQTCIVEIYHSENRHGTFYFVEGDLYNAVCGDREGEEAAIEMIPWEKVRININNNVTADEIEKKIERGLLKLLMEGSRHKDKSARDDGHITSGQRVEHAVEDSSRTTTLDNEKQIPSDLDIAKETGAGSKSKLVKILEKTSGLFEYCVFDERDVVQDKSAESKATIHVAPSLHFHLSDSICDLVGGGSLKYLGFNTHSGVRYLLMRMNKSQVVVGLNPGIKPGDFLNEILISTTMD
ncbi:MAG TPA: DUF4388 domain-containing protein [Syntrophales bacterium]|nr:DUF4388 domain-containing protein [Syntrophales bacterium]